MGRLKQHHYLLEGLDRITIDTTQDNPQPCIRGTTITVWDVVKQVVPHSPKTNISDIFPDLEPQDIQQALIFAVRELTEAIAVWRNEGLGPIVLIEGYSKLLLGKDDFDHVELTDELRQQSTEIIFVNSHRAMAAWWHLGGWMQGFYEHRQRAWQPFAWDSIIHSVTEELPHYEPQATVEVILPDGLPPIRGDFDLRVALVNLMTDRTYYLFDLNTILALTQESPDTVTVRIRRKFKYPQSGQEVIAHVFDWNCTPLSTAAHIIREHGSELWFIQPKKALHSNSNSPSGKNRNRKGAPCQIPLTPSL